MPSMKWYVVHTYSGFEDKVRQALAARVRRSPLKELFGDILIPTETVIEKDKAKKEKQVKRKFFPSYILVQMVLTDQTWHLIKETPKVTGFVGNSTNPPALSDDEVAELRAQMAEGEARPKPRITFDEGEPVRVVAGPFQNFTGMVEKTNPEKARLTVLVSIFGRATPIELDYAQVEKE